jgi:hypothetical protein
VGVCGGTCRGGRGAGLELGGNVGATIPTYVRAVRAGEQLKEGGGKGLASEAHSTDARAHDGPKRRQGDPTEQREGERKRGAGRRRQAGPACQRPRARGCGHARVAELSGPKYFFYFPGIFQLLFYLFSLGFQFKFKPSFKFKLIQTCATIQRIFKLNMMQYFMTHNILAKINN